MRCNDVRRCALGVLYSVSMDLTVGKKEKMFLFVFNGLAVRHACMYML